MSRVLNVWWDERLVGRLSQNRHGELGFAYAPEWLRADDSASSLSVSLPLRAEPFSRPECGPFFSGLLPDEGQRDAVARRLGVSRGNVYALLERLGGDVAGALQLLPPGESPVAVSADAPAGPLDPGELAAVLDALPVRPLLAGEKGLRLSLAGAHSKLPVVLVDSDVALPVPGQATTHILKAPILRFPDSVENEALVMRLAARIGLDTAPVEARDVDDRKFLVVGRYDRRIVGTGPVARIHQEDFCQALGIWPERKYAGEGGPTLRDCFELLRGIAARPAVEVLKLMDATIFNLIAGNADAHGKNFSLLYTDSGPVLAPLYDLLTTIAYPELSPRLAMKIGKRRTLDEMDGRGWESFASEAGLGLPLVRRRVAEIAAAVRTDAGDVAGVLEEEGLDGTVLAGFVKTIAARANRCASTVRR
ncbi:MAG: type II toxin-antitoxin system HipA family toxin [Gammaproteobacteria bacterium]|nr:type II toxin-antitoxin system HipA family toxin [Gammaproteobacteria bacterium]